MVVGYVRVVVPFFQEMALVLGLNWGWEVADYSRLEYRVNHHFKLLGVWNFVNKKILSCRVLTRGKCLPF